MAANPSRMPQRRPTRLPKPNENDPILKPFRQRLLKKENPPPTITYTEGADRPDWGGQPAPQISQPKRFAVPTQAIQPSRPVLREVKIDSVNRLVELYSTDNDKSRLPFKKDSAPPQRVPVDSGKGKMKVFVKDAHQTNLPTRIPNGPLRAPKVVVPDRIEEEIIEVKQEPPSEMDTDDDHVLVDEEDLIANELEVEKIDGPADSEFEEEAQTIPLPQAAAKPPRTWPDISTERALKFKKEVQAIRSRFEDDLDMYDPTMVSEYAEEIFEYMYDLEEEVMPNAHYMDGQSELTWAMRQTLVDWLLQVHLRYHMLPETLWIAVNIIDRFLTKRVVAMKKLQLVGVTAMFIAAKYEEILAPSVEEFVFMTENNYNKTEIIKGEQIMLQTLDFHISHYCSPYSWMRKISKADEYDIQTRALSKFLMEVTLLDHRFLPVKPSMVAAVGMYCARRMLGGDWNEAFVFFSGYTEEQLVPGHNLLVEKLTEANFSKQYVSKKYANKKFLRASVFALDWARNHFIGTQATSDSMVLA